MQTDEEQTISIHALLAESDINGIGLIIHIGGFLSTLSLRRATKPRRLKSRRCVISIHALLAESDCAASITPTPSRNFYPRSPCGERRGHDLRDRLTQGFLSTLSLRRATNGHETAPYRVGISIHALLAESDSPASITPAASRNFYPRSPCGERQHKSEVFIMTN